MTRTITHSGIKFTERLNLPYAVTISCPELKKSRTVHPSKSQKVIHDFINEVRMQEKRKTQRIDSMFSLGSLGVL